jgi:hypothetical protein
MLVAAGCSSDSGSGDGKDKAAEKTAASKSASPSPTVQAAAYGKLPEPCSTLSKKTLEELVPKSGSGKEGASNDTATRGSCSWDSLDDNGVKGSQFRWLSVSMLRFESDVARGAGDKLARDHYMKQLQDAQKAEGAQSVKTTPVSGTGDEAAVVRYDLKKKEGTFKQQTVVARVENVVVTVDYTGRRRPGQGRREGGQGGGGLGDGRQRQRGGRLVVAFRVGVQVGVRGTVGVRLRVVQVAQVDVHGAQELTVVG